MFKPIIYRLFIIILLFKGCSTTKVESQKINGVNLVSPPKPITKEEIQGVKELGANWISIIPYAFTNPSEAQVAYGDDKGHWWGEKPSGTKVLIEHAKKLGFNVMLKPHLWVLGQGWAGDLSFANEAEWEHWEKDYTKYILEFALIAEENECELVCIGTELRQSIKKRPFFWENIIKEIRKVYHGKLTYAANWDNYRNVSFWNELDYIGIDAYFPLSSGKNPSKQENIVKWKPIIKELKTFSKEIEKPILFTEYGYRSIDYTTLKPWEARRYDEKEINELSQANAYLALYQSFWNQEWFAGGFLWKWYPSSMLQRRPKPTGFTPQGKEAELVIRKQYH